MHHVAIAVRDLAACEAFYAGVLGLPVLRRWPAADGAGRSLGLARSRAAARSWRSSSVGRRRRAGRPARSATPRAT